MIYRFLLLFLLCFVSFGIHARTINIGIILDGPSQREFYPLSQIKHEIIQLNGSEFDIRFPTEGVINGHWQVDKIEAAITKLNHDNSIDIIIAHGLLSSHAAAHFPSLNKPIIGTIIADRNLQDLPYRNGMSNKNNFTYIYITRSIEQDIRQFHKLIPFKHMALPFDSKILSVLPEAETLLNEIEKELDFKLTYIPIINNLSEASEQLPIDTDAVYVAPLMRFDSDELQLFSNQLISKKLPSFSLLGRADLELGFMATLDGRKIDTLRFSRRVALMVQSILSGINASQLKVDLEQPPKLAINMRTAKSIDFYPSWKDLETAEILFNDTEPDVTHLSLADVIQHAIAENLQLSADQININLADDQVDNTRSALLPQANTNVNMTQVNQKRAGFLQAERTTDAEIKISQLIYSERRWSDFDVAKLLKNAQDAQYKSRILDVMSQSAVAYLQVLLANATEKIRQANLKVSESNLELAQQRVQIGYSNRAEELRWKSVIATDRSAVYAAQASEEQRKIELKRQLNLPLGMPIAITNDGIEDQINMLEDQRFQHFYENSLNFNQLIDFEINRALNNAPEREEIDHLVQSSRRQLDAGKRAYYIPDISFNATLGKNLDQGGIPSSFIRQHQENWSVNVQASLPIFTSGARSAEVSRASHAVIQNRYRREDIRLSIEARVRAALQKTQGSYPSIRLSRDAAVAAKENFSLVSDSYASGLISITSLIDAQNAMLSAQLSAVEALYSFLIDWVEVQRSVANFDVLLSTQGIENWYQESTAYYLN